MIAIGAAISLVNGGDASTILVVAFPLFGLCFAAFARWLPKGHAQAFQKDADALEAAMNEWVVGAEHRNRA